MKRIMIGVIVGVVILVILLGVAIFFLLQPTTPTDKIRDVFIIIVALESLIIGVAIIVSNRSAGKPDQPFAKRSAPYSDCHQ